MADKVYNESMCAIAEQLFSDGKSIARIAANLGVCRETIYDWRDKHPEFSEALARGKEAAQAKWEDLGEDGISGNIDKFSATAWIFTMKNRFRNDYKEDKEAKPIDATIVDKLLDRLVD